MEVEGRNFSVVSQPGSIYCKPCGDDTKRVPANGLCRDCEEHMCIACFGNHKKYKMCKDHVLLDINAEIKATDESVKREDDYEECALHDCESVKFYCPKHDQVACGDCIILKHKTCDVKYIRDIAMAFKASKDLDHLVDKVKYCQREAELSSTSISLNKVQVIDIHSGYIAAIQSFRDEINEHLDKLEQVSIQQASELKATDTTRMSVLEHECEGIAKELSQMNNVLESQSDDPRKLFVSAMQYKRGINTMEQKLRNINTRNKISLYCFNRDDNVQSAFIKCIQLGSVLHRTDSGSSQYSDYSDLEYMDSDEHYTVLDYTLPVTINKQENNMHSSTLIPEMAIHASTCKQYTTEHPPTVRQNSIEHCSTVRQNSIEPIPTVRENSIEHCSEFKLETTVRLPVRASRKDKKRGKHWPLFDNQQRCDNILMAREYMSFKKNEACAVGLYVGKKPIKTGCYFEVEIISMAGKGTIGVGFVPKDYPLEQVGVGRLSVGYHARDGCIYEQSESGERIGPPCGIGDRMGIGIVSSLTTVFQTKLDIFFTRNGKTIGELHTNSPSFCKLYPAIGMQSAGDTVRTIMDAKTPRT